MLFSNIAEISRQNQSFRKILFTNEHSQVVLMSIKTGDDIGLETHEVDQILYFVSGEGKAFVNGEEHTVLPGDMVDVPAGTEHNFINTGHEDLKLFTVYAPAEHSPGTEHKTKAEADDAEKLEHQ